MLVNKLSYELHDVHRGDIVVFAAEPNVEWHRAGINDLVKRVIALPGETITQCQTDRVCIDDRVLDESYLPKGTVTTIPTTLPYITNAAGKRMLVCDADSPEGGCKVPAGQVLRDGRQPRQLVRRAAPTARSRNRASSAASSCASGRPTASASCKRAQSHVARDHSLHSPTVATMRSTWSE